ISCFLALSPYRTWPFALPSIIPRARASRLFPYTTLFRSDRGDHVRGADDRPPESVTVEDSLGEEIVDELLRRVLVHGDLLEHDRSEEHTSELQSPDHLVCRLLLEKKKPHNKRNDHTHETA